jgi:hypothetical protein
VVFLPFETIAKMCFTDRLFSAVRLFSVAKLTHNPLSPTLG